MPVKYIYTKGLNEDYKYTNPKVELYTRSIFYENLRLDSNINSPL